jgi:hypothetical protein
LLLWRKRRNGRKSHRQCRDIARGDKLVTLMWIVNQFGARMKRVSSVSGPVA